MPSSAVRLLKLRPGSYLRAAGAIVRRLVGLSPLEYLAHHACWQRSGKEGQRINPDRRFLPAVTRVEVRLTVEFALRVRSWPGGQWAQVRGRVERVNARASRG
jgi:hypothetical protein